VPGEPPGELGRPWLCQPQGVQPKPLPLNSVCVSAVLPDRQALVETPAADPAAVAVLPFAALPVVVLPVITGEALGFALVTVVLGVNTGIGLVLVKVPAGVVAAPGKAVVVVGVALSSVGSETAPVPTWPKPGVPVVAAAGVVLCSAGSETAPAPTWL
jgi:hypothetical protein